MVSKNSPILHFDWIHTTSPDALCLMTVPSSQKSHIERLPIVGVMGSGKSLHLDRSSALGRWLAERNVHLLCGGGGGVMLAVSKAFAECTHRKGRVIGIIPGKWDAGIYSNASGYPNDWIEIPIFTHLPFSGTSGIQLESRNHINVLTSDTIVILPGSAGTASEAQLAVRYGKPAIAWLDERADIAGLPAEIQVASEFERVKMFVDDCIGESHG